MSVIFELGKSKSFGRNSDVTKGNYGTNFWGNNIFKFDGSRQDRKNLLISMKKIVRILTGKNIPVRYASEGQDISYTNGKQITISSIIDPESLDSHIGLALHEGSHIVKTDFEVIKNLVDKKNIPNKYKDHTIFIKDIHNWIEDRWIDNWAFNEAPGYKIYYHELYDRYFYCDEIAETIKDKKDLLLTETAKNYEFFIFNSLHPEVKMDELKGLPKIKKLLDINNISRFKNTQETLDLTLKVIDVIFENISKEEKEKVSNINLPSLDDLDKLISKILEMQESLGNNPIGIDGNLIKIELTDKESALLDALIKSDTNIEQVSAGKNKTVYEVITVNHIDEETILSDLYKIFTTDEETIENQSDIIKKALNFGKMLGKRLKGRDDDYSEKNIRIKTGILDNSMLYSVSYDSDEIFYNIENNELPNKNVHITLDLSSSMNGDKWEKTLYSTIGIAKATSMVSNIRTQISLRFTDNIDIDKTNAIVALFYDSDYDNVKKLNLFKYVKPNGWTPEGLCFEALFHKILKPLLNKDTLFINFSDGYPTMDTMEKQTGIEVTKIAVDFLKKQNVKILSYFISSGDSISGKSDFIKMYGKESEFIKVDSLIHLAKSINQKLLN